MAPKKLDKMRHKEHEFAEIDRDFARHFNAVAAEKEGLTTTTSHVVILPGPKSPFFKGDSVAMERFTSDVAVNPCVELFVSC